MKLFTVQAKETKAISSILTRVRSVSSDIGTQLVELAVEGSSLNISVGTASGMPYDRQARLTVTVPVQAGGNNGTVTVLKKNFLAAVKASDPTREIRASIPDGKDGVILKIVNDGFTEKRELERYHAKDFVPHPSFTPAGKIPLPATAIHGLRRLNYATSKDDTRTVINGIFLDPSGHIVATDGRRMTFAQMRTPKIPAIIPNSIIHILSHKLMDGAARLSWNAPIDKETTLRIQNRQVCLTFETIPGKFPNYRQVIPDPTEVKGSLTIAPANAARLLKWLRQRKDHVLYLEAQDPTTLLLTRIPETPKGAADHSAKPDSVRLRVTTIGDIPDLGLSSNFFTDAIADGFHSFDMGDSLHPLTGSDGLRRHVLMTRRDTRPQPKTAAKTAAVK